jgi:uncharacterized membrane protein
MKTPVRVRTLLATLTGLTGPVGLAGLTGLAGPLAAQELADSAVRAVLFYAPTCPHCHEVIQQHLPLIFANHGGTPRVWSFEGQAPEDPVVHYASNGELVILLVDTTRPAGTMLYQGSVGAFNVPADRRGVPQLVVGSTVLVGSFEIPDQLPVLISEGAEGGGLDWPAISGLPEFVAGVEAEIQAALAAEAETQDPEAGELAADSSPQKSEPAAPQPASEEPAADSGPQDVAAPEDSGGTELSAEARPSADTEPQAEADVAARVEPRAVQGGLEAVQAEPTSMMDRFRRDPVGNGLAVLVLLAMIFALGVTIRRVRMAPEPGIPTGPAVPSPAVPVLAGLGLLVAAYLTYVETQGAAAVCGPVGDCNTVQQSQFALFFGVPVGVLGLAGYAVILIAWLVERVSADKVAAWASIGLYVTAFIGTMFSVYLTFLEPFVIGATCAWCLTSAILITALMWLSAQTARSASARIRQT